MDGLDRLLNKIVAPERAWAARQRKAAQTRGSGQWLKAMPYGEYLKTRHWQRTAQLAKARAGNTCGRCGRTYDDPSALAAHHLTYSSRGREKQNHLQVLCHPCHAEIGGFTAPVPGLAPEPEFPWLLERK